PRPDTSSTSGSTSRFTARPCRRCSRSPCWCYVHYAAVATCGSLPTAGSASRGRRSAPGRGGHWRSAPPLTKPARSGSTPRMRPALVLAIALMVLCLRSATAMVGGAPAAAPTIARHVVLIVGSGGTFCSGVAIARDLVLTAAHCTQPGADYKLMELDAAHQPTLRDVANIAPHPPFDLNTLLPHPATADPPLIKPPAPPRATS